MNRLQAGQIAEVMLAYADGKNIQMQNPITKSWFDINDPAFNISSIYQYRVKPEPVLRAWKINEVPKYALFKLSAPDSLIRTITGTVADLSGVGPAIYLNRIEGVHYPSSYYFLEDLVTSHSEPLFSVDGGRTWQRCGIYE